ncbi:hypothetical protein [Oceanobacter mangrovi]|uniref:hypothetical protein n=1 Tax=Oceanobacter mangrovi TaxID=2862510 RepID=UPI001C8DA15D|nr:hypothetical protein [Oceanobacter mangrovi]
MESKKGTEKNDLLAWSLGILLFSAADSGVADMHNAEAVIPPQCYTKTEGKFNPCYICHQTHPKGSRRNVMNDGELQGEYSFSEVGETNHWANLFHSRQAEIDSISHDQILSYVREDNYSALLQADSGGYVADLLDYGNLAEAFDDMGFARDGSGWVAFNYKPLPSTFWPTNGNFDDVIIRLPEAFRLNNTGETDNRLYLLNLSLVEMAIKQLDSISIPATDEAAIGVDLDGDGVLQTVSQMWARDQYLGQAANVAVQPQQYPIGTEFLHSLRYLDVDADGSIQPARRMKELRYSRKYKPLSDVALRYAYNQEHREKLAGKLPTYSWQQPAPQAGMNNKLGWVIQGWIEDQNGQLRLQNYEENFFCMGCHTTTGTTIDNSFAFPRKVTGAAGWGYINLRGMADVPNYSTDVTQSTGEYQQYLERVGGGDEFRQNREMIEKWFNRDGSLNKAAVAQADVYQLITPSRERALALNKAYQLIVREQSFYLGRDAVLGEAVNVYQHVDQDAVPLLPASRQFHYDLRLQWPTAVRQVDTGNAGSSVTAADPQQNSQSVSASAEAENNTSSGGALGLLALWVLMAVARCARRA